MGVPHLRIMRRNGHGASMLCLGVLVHCPSCLGATVAVLAAEVLCGDRMFTNWTLESAKTVHHFDGVISHSFKSSRLSRYDSEPKLPSLRLVRTRRETSESERIPSPAGLGREWSSISLTTAYGHVETDAIRKAIHQRRQRTSKCSPDSKLSAREHWRASRDRRGNYKAGAGVE
jgi:hypothetical protein